MAQDKTLCIRLDEVSHAVMSYLRNEAGGSNARAIRRLIHSDASMSEAATLPGLDYSMTIRLGRDDVATLDELGRAKGLGRAETIRRLLRAKSSVLHAALSK